MGKMQVGTAGWHYPDWKGIVYPRNMPKSQTELAFLAEYLDLVEVNSTFYHIPEQHNADTWLQQSRHNPRFQFTIKLWQGFTHEARPAHSAEMEKFRAFLQPLHECGGLATVLIQFPWSYKKTTENLDTLNSIVHALSPYPCHIEFRHASWHSHEILAHFREQKIGWVNIDQPIIGDSMVPTREWTAVGSYFRFHGRNYDNWFREGTDRNQRYDYLYSPGELAEWTPAIKESIEKTEKCIVVFNNHFKGQAFANSLQLLALLSESKPTVPQTLAEYYPVLRTIGVLPPTQGTLALF